MPDDLPLPNEIERRPGRDPVERAVAVSRSGFEPFDGLLAFCRRTGGRIEVTYGAPYGWQIGIAWHSIGEGRRRIFAEDGDFEQACVLCRGLLAHALASGTVKP